MRRFCTMPQRQASHSISTAVGACIEQQRDAQRRRQRPPQHLGHRTQPRHAQRQQHHVEQPVRAPRIERGQRHWRGKNGIMRVRHRREHRGEEAPDRQSDGGTRVVELAQREARAPRTPWATAPMPMTTATVRGWRWSAATLAG